jgi:hypothetical protein
MIFGQKVNLLSIEKDKQDGFIATITTDPVALFDNLDEHISWLPPALSRLATGVTFSRRRLYTTNEKVEFPGVSWLGITSRTLTFMDRQPDLPDRTLVLKLERFPERRPEEDLLSAVALRRNALWSELLDELNAVVRYMSEHPEPVPVTFRMADFAAFALKVATVWRCREEVCTALAKMEEAQKWLLSEKDPVHQILERWLKIRDNRIRLVGAGELYCEWNSLADQEGVPWPYSSAKSLGLALTHLRPGLESRFGLEVTYDSHLKQNRYRFGRQPESPQNSPSETDESRDALEELAGFAGSSKP